MFGNLLKFWEVDHAKNFVCITLELWKMTTYFRFYINLSPNIIKSFNIHESHKCGHMCKTFVCTLF